MAHFVAPGAYPMMGATPTSEWHFDEGREGGRVVALQTLLFLSAQAARVPHLRSIFPPNRAKIRSSIDLPMNQWVHGSTDPAGRSGAAESNHKCAHIQ